jgi:hypothetical protein
LRWKLLVTASVLAALAGAGGGFGLAHAYSALRPGGRLPSELSLLICAQLAPLAASALAAVFVYRHTARRRKLQVLLTVLFALALSQLFVFHLLPFVPHSHD